MAGSKLSDDERMLADFNTVIQQAERTTSDLFRSIVSDIYLLSARLTNPEKHKYDGLHDFILALVKKVERLHNFVTAQSLAVKKFAGPLAESLQQTSERVTPTVSTDDTPNTCAAPTEPASDKDPGGDSAAASKAVIDWKESRNFRKFFEKLPEQGLVHVEGCILSQFDGVDEIVKDAVDRGVAWWVNNEVLVKSSAPIRRLQPTGSNASFRKPRLSEVERTVLEAIRNHEDLKYVRYITPDDKARAVQRLLKMGLVARTRHTLLCVPRPYSPPGKTPSHPGSVSAADNENVTGKIVNGVWVYKKTARTVTDLEMLALVAARGPESAPNFAELANASTNAISSALARLGEQGKISKDTYRRNSDYGAHGSLEYFSIRRACADIQQYLRKGRASSQEIEVDLRWGKRRTAEALAVLIEDRRVVFERENSNDWYLIPEKFVVAKDSSDALPSFSGRFSDADVLQLVILRGPATALQLANCAGLPKNSLIPALARLTLKGNLEELNAPMATMPSWRPRGSVELNSFGQLSGEMIMMLTQTPMSAAEFSRRAKWDYQRVLEVANLLLCTGGLVRIDRKLHVVESPESGGEEFERLPAPQSDEQSIVEQVFELVRTRGAATAQRLASCTTIVKTDLEPTLDQLVDSGRVLTEKAARHIRYYIEGEADWAPRARRDIMRVLSHAGAELTSREIARESQWDFVRTSDALKTLVTDGAVDKFSKKADAGRIRAHYRLSSNQSKTTPESTTTSKRKERESVVRPND